MRTTLQMMLETTDKGLREYQAARMKIPMNSQPKPHGQDRVKLRNPECRQFPVQVYAGSIRCVNIRTSAVKDVKWNADEGQPLVSSTDSTAEPLCETNHP